jgi:ABC-type phosphate transport system substrate-binding protein
VSNLLGGGRTIVIVFTLITLVVVAGPVTVAAATSSSTLPTLEGTGSSLASPAMQQWVGQAAAELGVNVNWQVSSSQVGLSEFAQGDIDFGGSDFSYSAGAVVPPVVPYQYIPDVGYSEDFMYNLVGNDGQKINGLVLDARTIGLIFTGAITKWDDPSIAALNPQLAGDLPDISITPVYRSDISGDNELLSDYLLHQDHAQFNSYLRAIGMSGRVGPSVTWPSPPSGTSPAGFPAWADGTPVAANGPDSAANYVSAVSSNGAITYVPYAYALEHDEPVASVVNASGTAVQPTSPNVTTALAKATLDKNLIAKLTGVFRDRNPSAYPVSGYSYVVAPCSPTLARAEEPPTRCSGANSVSSPYPADRGEALGEFLNFTVCRGQQNVALLGYAPLPLRLVRQDFSGIGRIDGSDEPATPTAANCP